MFRQYMELAIPLIALGGLFVVSNQKKREGFNSVNKYVSSNQTTDKFFKPNKTYMEQIDTATFTDLAGYGSAALAIDGTRKTLHNRVKLNNRIRFIVFTPQWSYVRRKFHQ